MAALLDQPARAEPQHLPAEPAALERGREEDVQPAVAVVGSVSSYQPSQPAISPSTRIVNASWSSIVGSVPQHSRTPGSATIAFSGFDVGGLQRPQRDAFAAQRRGVIAPASLRVNRTPGVGCCGTPQTPCHGRGTAPGKPILSPPTKTPLWRGTHFDPQAQGHCRPGRALECPAPQDRHLRMARVHRDRVHGRRRRSARRRPTDAQKLNGESRQADADPRRRRLPGEVAARWCSSRARRKTADDPAFKAAVADVTKTRLQAEDRHQRHQPQISKDSHSALVQFDLKGDPETADDARRAGPGRHRRRRRSAIQALAIEQYGDA